MSPGPLDLRELKRFWTRYFQETWVSRLLSGPAGGLERAKQLGALAALDLIGSPAGCMRNANSSALLGTAGAIGFPTVQRRGQPVLSMGHVLS